MLAGAAGMVICRPLLLSLFLRGGGTPGKCPLSDGDLQELAPPLPPSLQRLLRCGGGDGSASASCGDGECGAEFRESFQGDADPAFRRQGRCCWALGSGLFLSAWELDSSLVPGGYIRLGGSVFDSCLHRSGFFLEASSHHQLILLYFKLLCHDATSVFRGQAGALVDFICMCHKHSGSFCPCIYRYLGSLRQSPPPHQNPVPRPSS